jgi:hypothetical protein
MVPLMLRWIAGMRYTPESIGAASCGMKGPKFDR